LNSAKQQLSEQLKLQQNLERQIRERMNTLKQINREHLDVEKGMKQIETSTVGLKSKISNTDMPQVLDYIQQKAREAELVGKIKTIKRKISVGKVKLRKRPPVKEEPENCRKRDLNLSIS